MADNSISIILTTIDRLSGPLGTAEKKLENFGAKAQAIGQNLEQLGTRVGGIGLAGQAALSRMDLDMGSLVSGAIGLEKSLTGVAATAGMSGDKAKAMVGEWSIAINGIAKDTNQFQADVAASFSAMVAKGMDPAQAMAMLKPIGQAATAAQANINDMAQAMEASFSKLHIPAGQAAQALDIMAQAGKAGQFELKDMAKYMPQLTSAAESLGMKGAGGLSQLAAAAQIASRASADNSVAANDLYNWLGKLDAAVTVGNFQKFGENLGEIKSRARESGDYIGYMAGEINRITGGDSEKIAKLFPDQEAGRFIKRLILDLDDYKNIGEQSFSAAGVAAQDFNTQIDTSAEKLKKLQINATADVNGDGVIKGILDQLNGISEWANNNPDLAKWLIYGTAGAVVGGAVLVGIGATVTAIGTLSTALAGLSAFLAANPVVLTILGIGAAAAAGWAFGTWLSGQIDVAVQAVTGNKFATLGTAIYDMVQWFKEVPAKIKSALAGLANDMKTVGVNIIQGIIDGMKARAQALWDSVKSIGSGIKTKIMDVLDMHSPSRVMAEVGENIGAGLVVGMENSLPDVKESAEKLAEVVAVTSISQPRNADGSFKSRSDAATQGTGMLGGLKEYAANVKTIADSTKDMMVRAFHGMEDALANFVKTGKLDFKSLADSIIADMIRMSIQQSITQPLARGLASFLPAFFANGGAVDGGKGLSAYSGQIVSQPTLFPFASGIGMIGEAGPEAILPLRRGSNGKLGVQGGGSNVTVNVINNANGAQATTRERNEGGNRIIDVVIEQVKASIAGDISRGAGPIPGAFGSTYGLNRVAGSY